MLPDLLQDELHHYGLSADDVSPIRSKDGVIVARVRFGDETAVLKCFENDAHRREIANYDILQNCGITTITVLGKSDRSILLEDIETSDVLRLGKDEDLRDPAVIKAIARWYKTLHTNGVMYVRHHGDGMYEEWDCFSPELISAIRNAFELTDSEGLDAITKYYKELRKRLAIAPRTLTYNDFYYTNLVVKKDASAALMFDYNMLGKGCYASDIRNIVYWLGEENKNVFFSEYGDVDDELMLLDEICAPVVTLYSAFSRGIFPGWATEAIENLQKTPGLIGELLCR